jgi:hypothetical protein
MYSKCMCKVMQLSPRCALSHTDSTQPYAQQLTSSKFICINYAAKSLEHCMHALLWQLHPQAQLPGQCWECMLCTVVLHLISKVLPTRV